MEVPSIIFYIILFDIGFIDNMVGLVLCAIRFPFVLKAETVASVTFDSNLAVNTLGATDEAMKYYKQKVLI